jgi:hypothetical protein
VSDPTKFFTTCARHCEARAYQITVRQQAAKIADLEKELSSVVAGLFSEHDLAIRDLEQRANTLWFALENTTNPEIIYNSRKHVLKEIKALKGQIK